MSKELEALENANLKGSKSYEIIKKAIRELEEIKEFVLDLGQDNEIDDWLYENKYKVWCYISSLAKKELNSNA